MTYWAGPKRRSLLQNNQIVLPEHGTFPLKRGPSRKLSSEQELLMTLMNLRLGLLTDDLAFPFQVSSTRVSQIFIPLDEGIFLSDHLVITRSDMQNFTALPQKVLPQSTNNYSRCGYYPLRKVSIVLLGWCLDGGP